MVKKMTGKYTKQTLDCGAKLIHQHRHQPPLSVIKFFFPVGSSCDPAGKEGLAVLTSELLTTSTEKLDIYQFSRFVENHGLKVSSSVGRDYTVLSFTAINENLPALFEIIEMVFNTPVFTGPAFERTKTRQLAEISSRADQTFSLAMDRGSQFFYGKHPYSSPLRGHEHTVDTLTPGDCRQFYRDNFSLSDLVVSTVGFCEPDKLEEIINGLDLEGNPRLYAGKEEFTPNSGREIIHKEIEQPTHLLFYPAPPLKSDNYIPLQLLQGLLGSGMGSILFQELREKRSLGYQVGVTYPSRRGPSCFVFYLGGGENEGTRFREGLAEIIDSLADKIDPKKFDRALNYKRGSFLMKHETSSDIARHRGLFEILGRGAEFDDRYEDELLAVNKERLRDLVREMFLPVDPAFVSVVPYPD
jgi:predicted Zn-dependent peptidase